MKLSSLLHVFQAGLLLGALYLLTFELGKMQEIRAERDWWMDAEIETSSHFAAYRATQKLDYALTVKRSTRTTSEDIPPCRALIEP